MMIVPLNPEILQTEADGPEMFNKETSAGIQNSDLNGIRSKYKELTRLKVLEPILPQKEDVGVKEVDWKMILMEEVNGLTKEEEELIWLNQPNKLSKLSKLNEPGMAKEDLNGLSKAKEDLNGLTISKACRLMGR
jgi:hypothetical protein